MRIAMVYCLGIVGVPGARSSVYVDMYVPL